MNLDPKTKVWNESGGRHYLQFPTNRMQELDKNSVYVVEQDEFKVFYLSKVSNGYVFDYKIYGLESEFVRRVEKSYAATNSNLGILLNGTKGTGKTVCCKTIANNLNQPTVIINVPFPGVQFFVNSIPQDITIFVDEYEKIYGNSNDMLTIMDGALNSEFKRMFLLTTNKLYIEDNLKQRPSRLRYLKTFSDLSPDVVEELVEDILILEKFKDECFKFISSLEIITVDIVKEILNEVNLHNESPFEFAEDFNVEMREGKYKIFNVDQNGNTSLAMNNANIYPRPKFNEQHTRHYVEVGGIMIGEIVNVIDEDTIMIGEWVVDEETGENTPTLSKLMVLRLEKTYTTHVHYAYGGYDDYGFGGRTDINSSKIAGGFTNILIGMTAEELLKIMKLINHNQPTDEGFEFGDEAVAKPKAYQAISEVEVGKAEG